MLQELSDRRLIFVTGKGGVGKSTVTAALGKALARSGRRTLVLETDTFSAMEDLFDYTSPGLEPVAITDHLSASNLDSEECFIATLRRFVPSERIARGVIKNRIARVFFKAAPSVNEVTILDQVRVFYEATDDRGQPLYDHILVDLPASGHAVTFLNVPETMHGMMRGIGPIATMSRQVADIISDPEVTSVVAICLPEEMPVNETIELEQEILSTLGRPLDYSIANMVHQSPLDADHRAPFEALLDSLGDDLDDLGGLFQATDGPMDVDEAWSRLIKGNALALGWANRDHQYLSKLHDELQAPILELPIVYESSGADIVDLLADQIDAAAPSS